jgi:hypothetical protein
MAGDSPRSRRWEGLMATKCNCYPWDGIHAVDCPRSKGQGGEQAAKRLNAGNIATEEEKLGKFEPSFTPYCTSCGCGNPDCCPCLCPTQP